MFKTKKLIFSLTIITFAPVFMNLNMPPAGRAMDNSLNNTNQGREVMEKAREVSQLSGLEAVSTLRIYDAKGRERPGRWE